MDGRKLMVLMSTEPDVVGEQPGKLATWSKDDGLTWSKPVSQPLFRGGGAVQLPDGRWIILPFSLAVHKDGSVGSPYPVIFPDKEEIRRGKGN